MTGNAQRPIISKAYQLLFLFACPLFGISFASMSPYTYNPANCTQNNVSCPRPGGMPSSNLKTYHQNVYLYGIPIIIFFGTVGNVIALIVLCQRTMRQTGTYFYMAVLAVADTAVLYFNGMRKWIFTLTNFDISLVSSAGCKITSFLNYWIFDFATWILVAMTVDRFLAVHSPLRAIQFSSISRIKKVLVVMAILDVGLNMHMFWTMDLDEHPITKVKYCKPVTEMLHFHLHIWPLVDAILYSFLPFILLLVFNIIIVQDMFEARRARKNLQHSGANNHDESSSPAPSANRRKKRKGNLSTSTWHLTLMLLVVTTVFLILSAPTCVFLIIRIFVRMTPADRNRLLITKAATTILLYVNHSLNFYLYCASGRKFRHTLVSLYKYARQRRRLSTSHSVTQNTRVSFNSLTGRASLVTEQSQAVAD